MNSKKKPKIGRGLASKPRAGWKRTTTMYTSVEVASAKSASGNQRVHMRRCHLCDTVSEQHGEVVSKCDGCGKTMAPFYFFNDEQVVIFTDHDTRPESPELTRLSQERLPIRGLTAFW